MKSIKEKCDRLLVIDPPRERIIWTALKGFNVIKTNELNNLEGMEMQIVMLNWKIKFERMRNTLDESEMNELKMKVNA